ncbi:hypothetical protein EX30DRAFT_327391 [Ascodesmis nigricans]|uniref:XPG-I domain-containing protein n=1 Tax=Ascodesmis nigricans TaxID=341454 RepID=A0A4S2N3G5_9PEZI|nr:hypothetical protein EX30DRAFT_327391 [Ascodesmis nigricans]
MGIQGLFKELDPHSKRVSLTSYALEHYLTHSRRLRIAIDASIWSFQVNHGGRGGHNPALRTLYYRLVRLLSLNVTPLFVFDGKERPTFKRGRKTNVHLTPSTIQLCKKLLKIFGVPFHTAPGEAEAECALLQKEGIVDAVMSEDVDTLMFGATAVLRDWGPAKKSKSGSAKVPTHVSVYSADCIKSGAKLDRSGMVLIALMHGGDYLPEGLPGCGIKTAMEAAAAGFGEELCALIGAGSDAGIKEWRQRLQRELTTNESKKFSKKNGRIKLSDEFPRRDLVEAYWMPIVSSHEDVETIRTRIDWDTDVDIRALREYARETFEWRGTGGATKFVRTLAPALIARWILDGKHNIASLVESVHGVRSHESTDECAEIRIAYTPANVIPIDAEREAEDDQLEASEQRGILDDDEGTIGERTAKSWVPDKPDRIWVLEYHANRTLGEHIERWEVKNKKKPKKNVSASTTATMNITTQQITARRTRQADGDETLDKYLTVLPGNIRPRRGHETEIETEEILENSVSVVEKTKKPRQAKSSRSREVGKNGNIRTMFTKVTKTETDTETVKNSGGKDSEPNEKPGRPAEKRISSFNKSIKEAESSASRQLELTQHSTQSSSFIPDKIPNNSNSHDINNDLASLYHCNLPTQSSKGKPSACSKTRRIHHGFANDDSDDELPDLERLTISEPHKTNGSRQHVLPSSITPSDPETDPESDPDEPPIKARQRLLGARPRKPISSPSTDASSTSDEHTNDDDEEIDLHHPFYQEEERPATPPRRTRSARHPSERRDKSPTAAIRRAVEAIDLTEDSPEPPSRAQAPIAASRTVISEHEDSVAVIPPALGLRRSGASTFTSTSISTKINKPALEGKVTATAKISKKKRTIMVLDLTNEP